MKRETGERRFSALIESTGLYVIEYRKLRDRIDIIGRLEEDAEIHNALDAGEALGNLLGRQSLGPAKVSIVMRGLGTSHHILVLPPAKPEILGSVVNREMRRLYPDINDPIVQYISGGRVDRRARLRPEAGSPPQEVLAAAIGRSSIDDLEQGLGMRDIAVDHITVLPSVLQKLHNEVGSSNAPSAVLMMLRDGPVFAFFHEGQLRLLVEPPSNRYDDPSVQVQVILEQIERGALYLRQQFRGAEIAQVHLSADPEIYEQIATAIRDNLAIEVTHFGAQIGSPGAVAALGAVLDAGEDGLNLYPSGAVRKKATEVWTQRLVMASALVLALASWIWAGSGVAEVMRLRSRVASLETAVARRAPTLQPIRDVVTRRAEHEGRITALTAYTGESSTLYSVLRVASLAGPAGVRLNGMVLRRVGASWNAAITASVDAGTATQAISSVHYFYRGVPRQVPTESITLTDLQFADSAAAGGVNVRFGMSFTASTSGAPATPSPAAAVTVPPDSAGGR